jgi:hypothetical protein
MLERGTFSGNWVSLSAIAFQLNFRHIGQNDQTTYSSRCHYRRPLTSRIDSSVEFVTPYHLLPGIIERTQLNSNIYLPAHGIADSTPDCSLFILLYVWRCCSSPFIAQARGVRSRHTAEPTCLDNLAIPLWILQLCKMAHCL